jgi:hypothetical protein
LLRLLLLWVCEVPVTAVNASLYIQSSMRASVLRSVAVVVLSLHVLPLGLPLFCDTDRHCDQQMPMPSGPSIDLTSNATTCATSLFCATMGTAAIVLSTPLSVSVSDSYVVAFDVSTFAPFDPQPPLPPPPQA